MTFVRDRQIRAAIAAIAVSVFASGAHAVIAIQRWVQPDGAQVYLVESPAIPMVDVQVDFDAGGRRDPQDKTGLASVTAGMTSRGVRAHGNQPALDENALSEAWTDLGASFGGSAGQDRMSFSLRSLTAPDLLARATALAARQIAEPAFPADVWQRERDRSIAALKEAETRPATIASRAYNPAVYGGHPYGRDATEATLKQIGVEDMQAYYTQRVRACRAKVSIVGAVTREQARQMVSTLLARLPAGGCSGNEPVVAEVPKLDAPRDIRIPFDSAQAHVLIGQPGYRRSDPDHFALTVGNYILGGGGFVSRLYGEVREKRGLSYSVYSYFSPGLHEGAFSIGLQTRPDQAAQAVQVSRDVLRQFVADGPTEAELKAAKDNLIGGFALQLDTNRKLLGNVSGIAWNNLPLNYLDTWTQRIEAVTVADIKAAFARKLSPDTMVTVVVGGKP
ncbi:M16 family metallopeptidase [Variovorax sp. VNK109]|jgi:zinc protease|uniref:M16 family metallopeptidase n=1 Tax=Variovorax sp. VNK109 TaxID=3400919 RepID=UPI003BFE9E8A